MPTSPAASPKTQSTVGLKNVVIAPVTSDTAAGITYGDLQLVAGAISATIAPANAEADVQYADDVEFDVVYPDPEITLTMSLAGMSLAVQEMLLSNNIDENGVLVRKAGDKPGYYALGFKSEMADGTFRYVWLYKCRANPITENYNTKEGTTINRTPTEVEFVAIKRTYDGYYQAVADEGQNGFSAEDAAAFLTSVYTPDFGT